MKKLLRVYQSSRAHWVGDGFPVAAVKERQQTGDLLWEEGRGGNLERRLGRTVLDDVAELCVAVFAQRLAERQGFGSKSQSLGDLVFGHLDFFGQF